MFPNIFKLPSRLKLEVSLTPPGPVTDLDEERGMAALPGKRLAVCLHPWSRLGGHMNDPVLEELVHPLTYYHKFYVLRYNVRGVGLSSGWKSLTGLQDADDLRELVDCALKRLGDVREVALIGYSYGALIASMHPILPAPLRTTHILISYPLGKRGLLTAFRSRTYQRALENLVRQPEARILLCRSGADDFTPEKMFDHWAEALAQLAAGSDGTSEGENGEEHQQGTGGDRKSEGWSAESGNNVLEVVRILDASHLWHGQVTTPLIEAVTRFLT
ncbi:Alpha/Beta hydrolase protein [Russula aff. rugulosa BPL654]|nr:Alpha/Beta hydrolase protein [Russula aff. rugulosa BPL654]